jgi:hypothetical protein
MRTFTLAEAARLIGTSRSVLYRAIEAGRLQYTSGGGPGKASIVTDEALRQAGFKVPPDVEHLERLPDVQRTSQATSPDDRRLHDLEQRLGHLERLVGRLEHELDLAVTAFTFLKSLMGQPGLLPVPSSTQTPPSPVQPRATLPSRARTQPLSQMRQQIVDLVREHPGGLSPVQIRELLKVEKDLGSTVKAMARDGILSRVETGRYVVAEGW